MNPKSVNDLDPKLKETYERVMGSSFSVAPTQAPQPQPQPQPIQTTVAAEPIQAVTSETAMQMQQPVEIPAMPASPEMVASPQMTPPATNSAFTQAFTAPANPMTNQTAAPKKKNVLMPVLFVVGGLLFFVAYAVIWAKVFGLF